MTEERNLTQKLQELNAAKDRFFSIISHDLRGSLGATLGFMELLKSETDLTQQNQGEIIEHLEKGLLSVKKLLDNLLTWARSQLGQITVHAVKLDAKSFINDALGIVKPIADQKQITIVNMISDKVEIVADTNIVATIVINLVTNAIKYSNPTSSIRAQSELGKGSCFTLRLPVVSA